MQDMQLFKKGASGLCCVGPLAVRIEGRLIGHGTVFNVSAVPEGHG